MISTARYMERTLRGGAGFGERYGRARQRFARGRDHNSGDGCGLLSLDCRGKKRKGCEQRDFDHRSMLHENAAKRGPIDPTYNALRCHGL